MGMYELTCKHRVSPESIPDGLVPLYFSFYVFAQRVAWGLATKEEIEAMGMVYAIANAFGDWDVCVNDVRQ